MSEKLAMLQAIWKVFVHILNPLDLPSTSSYKEGFIGCESSLSLRNSYTIRATFCSITVGFS